jgi:hypothetical protein
MELQKYIVLPKGAEPFIVEAHSTTDIRINVPDSYLNMNNIVTIMPLSDYKRLNP